MRFMILVRATIDSEAGVLLGGAGLQASAKGWRVSYDGAKCTSIDGPFTEAKELVAGYTLIQVRSRDEAVEWARRFPNPAVERFRDMKIGSH